ncbi:hypothetical protein G5B35_17305 [Parapusillimonas sp. SGNA-6]|nr:hypothetical protein [Parapusillimonas sp. SGNA-6]
MLVKPRTPTPFRPLQTGAQQRINQERAVKASPNSVISMSRMGHDRYAGKQDNK